MATTTSRAAEFSALHDQADAAGREAVEATTPTPQVFAEHTNPLDDASPVRRAWYAPGGLCGFGWVSLRPATSGFAKWLKANGYARKSYYGGIEIHAPRYTGQSVELKEAYCRAYARVLNDAGYTRAYAESKLD